MRSAGKTIIKSMYWLRSTYTSFPQAHQWSWPYAAIPPPRIEVNVYNVQVPQSKERDREEPKTCTCTSHLQTLKSVVTSLNGLIDSMELTSQNLNNGFVSLNLEKIKTNLELEKIEEGPSHSTFQRLQQVPDDLLVELTNQSFRTPEDPSSTESSPIKVKRHRTHISNAGHLELVGSFVPLRNLKSLYFLLIKFFQSKEITIPEIEALSDWELEILGLIIRRKYGSEAILFPSSRRDAAQYLNALSYYQRKLPIKRPEESYKFVFTRAIKYLRKVFKVSSALDARNTNSELEFYKHYFQKLALQEQVALENFVYPLNSKDKPGKLRSPNLNYFRLIFMSEAFVEDLTTYTTKFMSAEHRDESARKTLNILVRWDSSINGIESESSAGNRLKADLSRYFLKNKRCKLPWTATELKSAIEQIQELFCKLNIDKGRSHSS